MSIIRGTCDCCQRECEVFNDNNKCIICTRLDAHDKMIKELVKIVETINNACK